MLHNTFANLILLTDSYKPTHWKQYPPQTRTVYSYLESRGGDFDETLFFGLQYFLKNYLEGSVVTDAMIDEAQAFCSAHFGRDDVFNADGWRLIVREHEGRLPVRIRAVPEGTSVPVRNVLMTVENTDPRLPWLTNYLETLLSQIWYPITVASNSRAIKRTVLEYHSRTSDGPLESVDFQVHDFGFRGVSSVETAALGAAAHLVSFRGTDTIAGILLARDFYGEPMAGFSIPASEHSTITAWGREGEAAAMENMLDSYPGGIVACVSDSFDVMNAVRNIWGGTLRRKILERNGRLVVRPDSGDPVVSTLKVMEALWDAFGGRVNGKGYRVLHPNVRMIQGDGIDREMIGTILESFRRNGFSGENIAFGSGGGLLQKFNRDTCRFAFKCSSIVVGDEERDVRKNPMEFTAEGEYVPSFKVSKGGRLALVRDGGNWKTVEEGAEGDILRTVFLNGAITERQTFEDIRARAADTVLSSVPE